MDFRIFKHSQKAAYFGLATALTGVIASVLLGELSAYKAQQLIQSSLPRVNTLCNTIILGSATILALLFTVLGLGSNSELQLKKAFYYRIRQVAFFDTLTLVITMIVFLAINFPIASSENIPQQWYRLIYYSTVGASSLVGGMMVFVIVLLYETIRDLITIIGLGDKGHPLAFVKEEEEE